MVLHPLERQLGQRPDARLRYAAFGRSQGYECPNSQATLGNVQDGLY